jgi:hypothetical protein
MIGGQDETRRGDNPAKRRASSAAREGEKGDMEKELTSVVDLAFKFIEAGWVELPGAVIKRLTAAGAERETHEAGWKAYDAWVRLADEAVNTLYADRAFGETMARAFETNLGFGRIAETLASAFFGNLWPAVGLPTASEVHALRGELTGLREELRAKEKTEQDERDRASRVAPRTVPSRPSANAFRPELIRGAREAKESVAV